MIAKADMLFETSWEITNKCGGIYTVISSKAKIMQKYYYSMNHAAILILKDEIYSIKTL